MKDRYQVGRVYSVVPKMYQPSVWWRFYDGKFEPALKKIEYPQTFDVYHSEKDYDNLTRVDLREQYSGRGFHPLKVRITDKRQELLKCLPVDDALAEGVYFNARTSFY